MADHDPTGLIGAGIVVGIWGLVAFFLVVANKAGMGAWLDKNYNVDVGAIPPMIMLWPITTCVLMIRAIALSAYNTVDFATTFLANLLKSK